MSEKKKSIFTPFARYMLTGLGEETAANVAGGLNILAHKAAHCGTEAENAFWQGKKAYKDEMRDLSMKHPYTSFLAHIGGVGIFSAPFSMLGAQNLARQGSLWHLLNRANSYLGARQLERALRRGVFDKDIFAGRFSKKRMDEINQVRAQKGDTPITDNNVYWDPNHQKHLWLQRILGNKQNPKDIANWQREAFFGKKSKVFPNLKKQEVTEIRTPFQDKSIRSFVTKKDGKTIGKTIFLDKSVNKKI